MPYDHSNDDNIWETNVGAQSSEEFMRISVDHDSPYSIDEVRRAVADYVAELPHMFPGEHDTSEDDDIHAALVNVISRDLQIE